MITFKEFKKMEMKAGTIKKVEEIPGSKNLLILKVDIGGEEKQAVAGIKGHYLPKDLEGKQYIFVTNLESAKLMGELSEVMILAAVDGDKVILIKPEKLVSDGTPIE